MKILGFNIGGKQEGPLVMNTDNSTNDKFYGFTSPFMNVGKGNLSLPVISNAFRNQGYVLYGQDNLFPNLLRQLKHTSPLHGNIMKYINNATIGGGYSFENVASNGQAKVDLYKFENKINLKKFLPRITQDALMFESINLLITNDSKGRAIKIKRIPQDELRWDESESKYTYVKDWTRRVNEKHYDKYITNKPNHQGIITFRFDDGDTIYPIPLYSSSNNWIFLDGESSYLHKSNILNSVFASTVFKFPRKPASDEEADEYRKTIESAKGAAEAGRSIAFFEQGIENLPIIETLPTSNNDKLFLQTDERTDTKICQAWSIDPILMGIRVSGKLGSGSDIKQSYIIFEKNVIMPLRNSIEEVINELMDLFGVKGDFEIDNYQIINETIIEVDGAVPVDDKQAEAQATLRGSVGGVQALTTIIQNVASGLMSRSSAISTIELIFGFSNEEAQRLLGDVEEGEATPQIINE